MTADLTDRSDTLDIKKGLETGVERAQDDRLAPTLTEKRNVRYPTQATPHNVGGGKTRVMYQHFADTLAAAMKEHGLNASEVARRIWGTTKDKRNYDVARNRDRIGHYLSGKSYPEPENLRKLAEAVGLTVEQLQMPESEGRPGPRAPRSSSPANSPGVLQLIPVPRAPNKVRLRGQVDAVIDIARVQEIVNLLMKPYEPDPEPESAPLPEPGTVLHNNGHRHG